jgi:hypothetical protein
MPQYYIINENTEDTLGATDSLQDAVRIARELASNGQAGDMVAILESGGMAVRQFILRPDGTVTEQAIASSSPSARAG